MTEQKIENNWYNNIAHLVLLFMTSWLFVGYIRTHILEIPYYQYGRSYSLMAISVCMALFFLLYKKVPPKVSTKQIIAGIMSSLFASTFAVGMAVCVVMDFTSLQHPYVKTAYFYADLCSLVPQLTYLMIFVNKKLFIRLTYFYLILGILSIIYVAA